jgi:hypothetical protein
MVSKINTHEENKTRVLLTALGAWVMAAATLFGAAEVSRRPVVVGMARPAYAYVNPGLNLWSRNDNENETVHMPTKYDIGLQRVVVGGRK